MKKEIMPQYNSGVYIALFFDYLRNAGIDSEKGLITNDSLFREQARDCEESCSQALEALRSHGDVTYYIQDRMNFLREQIHQLRRV